MPHIPDAPVIYPSRVMDTHACDVLRGHISKTVMAPLKGSV